MSRAWLFQDGRQKAKLGPKACPWSVGYFDDEGRRKSKRIGSKSAATKYARKVEGELASGTYQSTRNKNWPEFRVEYLERGLAGCAPRSVESAKLALGQFEKLIKPVRVNTITSRTIADYVSKRLAPRISKDDKERPPLSPATINRELRTLRAALRRANRWGYLPRVPHFDFLKVPGRLPTFVSAEHFSKLYEHAGAARWPNEGPYTTADWWQALFVMAYMTGWRISSLLALKWADVDLENGFALSRAEDNKGKRDQRVPLHPVVVDHLRKLVCFSATVFAWEHAKRALFTEFYKIQKAAGVRPEGGKSHYGFHDFRRAFATLNAGQMSGDALQVLMQHKSYQTTQGYINLSRQLSPAVQNLFVPQMPKVVSG